MARHNGSTKHRCKPTSHCLQTTGDQNIDQVRLQGLHPRKKESCACMVILVPTVREIFGRIYGISDEPSSVRCPRNQVSRNKGPVDSTIFKEPNVGAELRDNSVQRVQDIRFATVKVSGPTSL